MAYNPLYSFLLASILTQSNFCYGMDDSPGGMKRAIQGSILPAIAHNVVKGDSFAMMPDETVREVIAFSPVEIVFVDKRFYRLSTGYDSPKSVGTGNHSLAPGQCFGNPEWQRSIDLARLSNGDAYLSSVFWYRFTSEVSNLKFSMVDRLKGTSVKKFDLAGKGLVPVKIKRLQLTETQVEYLDLSWNEINKDGANALNLKDTQVKTLDLSWNNLGDDGAKALQLPGSNVKTLILHMNQIGDDGAKGLQLQGSQVQTVYLGGKNVSEDVRKYLQETYPAITFNFNVAARI